MITGVKILIVKIIICREGTIMIAPRKIKHMAEKMERENLEFRTFLKCNADEKIIDEQFAKLHKELFAEYDCSRCRNCCKCYYGSIPLSDINKDASHLNMSPDEFVELYLSEKGSEGNYRTKHKPCDFLQEDGSSVYVANSCYDCWKQIIEKSCSVMVRFVC